MSSAGCTMDEVQVAINEMLVGFVEYYNAWNRINYYVGQINTLLNEMMIVLNHIHRSHAHPWFSFNHSPENIQASPAGLKSRQTYITPIETWLRESYSREDLNDDGKVYGCNFSISNNDSQKPISLKSAEMNIGIVFNVSKFPYGTIKEVSTFVESLSALNYPQRPVAESIVGKLSQELILGEKVDTTSLCQKSIYGYTFIIDPNDPEKPEELTELEQLLDVLPKNKISWAQYLKDCTSEETSTSTSTTSETDCSYVCTRLVGEWLEQFDIDMNGLIYGTDFKLSDDDPHKLQCLKNIEMDIDWNPPADIKILSWEEFCKTFENGNPDDRGDMED